MKWIYLSLTLLLAACATGGGPERAGEPLGKLPATFSGILPCADCPGIDYQLNLFEDGAYYLRTRYQGRADGQFDDIGRYLLSSDGALISLHGGREEALRFGIESQQQLRLMGHDGRPIESTLNYTLERQEKPLDLQPRLVMRGMYRYLADAGRFRECLTGRDMPVATEADNRALELAYLGARQRPGEPLLVKLEGRIAPRMPMEGPGPVATLIPERFLAIQPDLSCEPPVTRAPPTLTYWRLRMLAQHGDEK